MEREMLRSENPFGTSQLRRFPRSRSGASVGSIQANAPGIGCDTAMGSVAGQRTATSVSRVEDTPDGDCLPFAEVEGDHRVDLVTALAPDGDAPVGADADEPIEVAGDGGSREGGRDLLVPVPGTGAAPIVVAGPGALRPRSGGSSPACAPRSRKAPSSRGRTPRGAEARPCRDAECSTEWPWLTAAIVGRTMAVHSCKDY